MKLRNIIINWNAIMKWDGGAGGRTRSEVHLKMYNLNHIF